MERIMGIVRIVGKCARAEEWETEWEGGGVVVRGDESARGWVGAGVGGGERELGERM